MGRDPEYLEFMRRRLAEPAEPGRGVAHARRAHAADLARSPRLPVGAVKDLRVDGAAGPLPARLYLPAAGARAPGGPRPPWSTSTAAAGSSATSTPTTRSCGR